MENAGANAARVARSVVADGRRSVVCVCGHGGNGGDAMVAARHLALEGLTVDLILIPPPREPSSLSEVAIQTAICRAMSLPMTQIRDRADVAGLARHLGGAGLIVDGIHGTGLTRPVVGLVADVVEAINASGVPVLALDVPTGLDCDSGEPIGPCVRATLTVTFVGP